jgi:hypothetical protein
MLQPQIPRFSGLNTILCPHSKLRPHSAADSEGTAPQECEKPTRIRQQRLFCQGQSRFLIFQDCVNQYRRGLQLAPPFLQGFIIVEP